MTPREKYTSLTEARATAATVNPSTIGGQFYCEKKVELESELGEVATPEKRRGSETHERAAEDAIKLTVDEMWDAIESGTRQVLLETTFVGQAADFLVVGKPDAIIFDDGKPQLIFDRKTTSIPGRLFKNQRIQVWLYGYLLESLGFDTDSLEIAILSHEQRLDDDTGKRLQEEVLDSSVDLEYGQTQLLAEPEARVHAFPYDRADHLEDLDWALEYWREERDPIPTTKAAKCRSCPYADDCDDSLA